MNRQVRIHDDDRKLQRILCRRCADELLRTYVLSTVTYGTASPPCLAISCLQQLAEDESKDFSLAPESLTNNFYVDDVVWSQHHTRRTMTTAITLRAFGKRVISLTQVLFQPPQHIRSSPS